MDQSHSPANKDYADGIRHAKKNKKLGQAERQIAWLSLEKSREQGHREIKLRTLERKAWTCGPSSLVASANGRMSCRCAGETRLEAKTLGRWSRLSEWRMVIVFEGCRRSSMTCCCSSPCLPFRAKSRAVRPEDVFLRKAQRSCKRS